MANDNLFGGIQLHVDDDPDFLPLDQLEMPEIEEKEDKKEKTDSNAEGEEEDSDLRRGRQEEEEKEADEGADADDDGGSPDTEPTSIATALLELKKVGALQTLTDEELRSVADASEIKNIIQREVENLRNEDQKRISDALDSGMRPDAIKFYEEQNRQLSEFDESRLEDEGEQGEKDRKAFITWMYKLKKYGDDDIEQLVSQSFDSGNDVKDAKKALDFCRNFFDKAYKDAINDAKEQKERQVEDNKKRTEAMKDSIMNGKGYLEDLQVSKADRSKIFDYIGKPTCELKDEDGNVIRDSSGRPMKVSELTKFCRENLDEANRLLATILVLTNEGKDFSKLFSGPVKKESNKNMRALEDALINGTSRDKGGSIKPKEGISQAVGLDQDFKLAN